MRKDLSLTTLVLLIALVLAPGAMAQTTPPEEIVQSYYAALSDALSTGDFDTVLQLFAEDATLTVPALSKDPSTGTAMMQTVFGGMSSMLQGATITLGEISVQSEQVTVDYQISSPATETPTPATDVFVIADGKIQSLTIELAAEAPVELPTTGDAGLDLLSALLALGGGALALLGRRLKR